MSKDKLFAYYMHRNPAMREQFENGRVTLTASGFMKFFNTTYDEGYKHGLAQEDDMHVEQEYERSSSSTLDDLMNLFGMR